MVPFWLIALGLVESLAGAWIVAQASSSCGDAGLFVAGAGLCEAASVLVGGLLIAIGLPQLLAGWALATARRWGRRAAFAALAVAMLLPAALLVTGLGALVFGDGSSITLVIGAAALAPYLWLASRLHSSDRAR